MYSFDIGDNGPKNYIQELLNIHDCKSVQDIILSQNLSKSQRDDIHSFWVQWGHIIRRKINNDLILENTLERVLPGSCGGDVTLFRGENWVRYNSGTIGFCWSQNRRVAEMFARGLNAMHGGGVLLQYSFSSEEIIAGISKHSKYLGEHEYTVFPSRICLGRLNVLERYIEVSINNEGKN